MTQFLRLRQGGMGGTCRWQRHLARAAGEPRRRQPREQLGGRCAIEGDQLQLRLRGKEGAEIIGLRSGGDDARVETTRPLRGVEHVPDRNARSDEPCATRLIGQIARCADERTHQIPELIARVSVVLTGGERRDAGQAAQYQYPRRLSKDRRKRADASAQRASCSAASLSFSISAYAEWLWIDSKFSHSTT